MICRVEALEALLIAYSDEPIDESRDVADAFYAKWADRVRAFLWTSMRATTDGCEPRDPRQMREREDRIMEAMREEEHQEQEAMAARQADDVLMAQALIEPQMSASLCRSVPEHVHELSGSSGGRAEAPGPKRARAESQPSVMTAVAMEDPEETSITVRRRLHKSITSRGVQRDE